MLLKNITEVWQKQLDPPDVLELELILTTAELAQADRCRLPLVRQRKIVARARLRQILSYYLDIAPRSIEISVGAYGKPEVQGLEFNVSHSENLALYAVSREPVGIDVEYIRALEMASLVQRFFAPIELAQWQQLPAEQREFSFFRAWTMKEAYLKAIGTGLHTSLAAVVVDMDITKPARFLATSQSGSWQLATLELPNGYAGAVVIRGGDHQIVIKDNK